MTAFYNENDKYPAAWLRSLSDAGHIAPGVVDERSIADLVPQDLEGYEQAHFFAGIGGWSLALKLAGWPDDRPVWTGSAPCQPWSCAGLGAGHGDARHLWPEWFRLIRECRPAAILGEQVTGAIGAGWLDGVFSDLESEGYACGALILEALSVGAPHRRQRIYWAAYSKRDEQPREEPRRRKAGRVGRIEQPVPWDRPWQDALAEFRVVDDGFPRSVGATDAARNAIVPALAAEFVAAFMEAIT